MGAHALQITLYHKRKTSVKLYCKLVHLLRILFRATHLSQLMINGVDWDSWSCGLCPFCVGLEYLRLKLEVRAVVGSIQTCHSLWGTKQIHCDHCRGVWKSEVFCTNTRKSISQSFRELSRLHEEHGTKFLGNEVVYLKFYVCVINVARNKIPSKWTSLRYNFTEVWHLWWYNYRLYQAFFLTQR